MRDRQAAPVVPEPPTRRSVPTGSNRIPEPPARSTAPTPARRRPASRILEALDAKLAAEQAEQAKAQAPHSKRDDAIRRVRPALSTPRPSRRPTPPKPPTPSVASSVPIAPRVPSTGRRITDERAPLVPDLSGAEGMPDLSEVVVPLPDPSVPPVPVIPLKPAATDPADRAGLGDRAGLVDEPPVAHLGEPGDDPLAASYERLVKAAKRQAALEAALAPEQASATATAPESSTPSASVPDKSVAAEPVAADPVAAEPVAPVPVPPAPEADHLVPEADRPAADSADAVSEEVAPDPAASGDADTVIPLAQADAQRPASDDATAIPDDVMTAADAPIAAGAGPSAALGEQDLGTPNLEDIHEAFEQAKRDAERLFGPEDFTPLIKEPSEDPEPPTSADTPDAAEATTGAGEVIIPEEVTPPAGLPVMAEGTEIEDAEIVADPESSAHDDIIGTIIATDLDLIAKPEAIEPVDPGEVAVDDAVLTDMPVSEAAVDEALASAPARVVEEETPEEPVVPEPPAEEPTPQGRGFRALTGILILIIFALVCIAAYRMMMRPGAGPVEPTPTPIVPTTQPERPGESASPSKGPKPSEPTPIPALPPREPLPSDAAVPPALPGQSATPEVNGGAGNVAIGQHTISISRINDVNLPGLIAKPVAGENVQVQSILGDGAYVWLGADQDNRILALIPEPFREALKDLQAGDRVDFVGSLEAADFPEILAPEQGRDRLIRQGAAINVRDITVRQ